MKQVNQKKTSSVLKNIAKIFNIDLNSLLDINNNDIENTDKIKYIVENCKYLNDSDLDFIVRIISIMREEYVKINTTTN